MISRIIFAALFGLVIISIAVFTAKIYSSGFKLSQLAQRNTVIPAVFLPLLYILSLIAIRSASSGIGNASYYALNVIGGIFFNIFVGAILLGLVLLVGMATRTTIPVMIPAIILIATLLLSLIGFVQARFIAVVDYTVILPGAPASWEGKTAVLVADTHFGIINHKKFSDKVVGKIIALKPDFVLHAGDFYDGPTVATEPITESWKRLAGTVPTFYAPGNHETYGDYRGFVDSIAAAGVTVLEDKLALYDGVQIAGLSYRDRGMVEDTKNALMNMNINKEIPAILITHPPTFHKEINEAGVSMMVSGHTHRGQFWPINYLVRMIYGKYTYGLQRFENMQALTTSGVGTFGPPTRLFNPPEIVRLTFSVK